MPNNRPAKPRSRMLEAAAADPSAGMLSALPEIPGMTLTAPPSDAPGLALLLPLMEHEVESLTPDGKTHAGFMSEVFKDAITIALTTRGTEADVRWCVQLWAVRFRALMSRREWQPAVEAWMAAHPRPAS